MFLFRAHLSPARPDPDHPGAGGRPDADRELDRACTPLSHPAEAHRHPTHGAQGGLGRPGGRLNLLLSHGSWNSDPWAQSLPRLLEPMGVTSILARSAREAESVIRRTPIHIAVVDLSLPLDDAARPDGHVEEAGPRVLELLSRLEQPPPTVVLKRHRSLRDQQAHMHAALRCGAFAVVDQTAANLENMLAVMQRCLHRFYDNRWPNQPPGDPGPNYA